jgi:hypothetical protein
MMGRCFACVSLVGRRIDAVASRNGVVGRICVFAPFLALIVFIALAPAKAQVAVTGAPTLGYNYSGDTINLLSPTPIGQHRLDDKPVRDYQGLPLEGWNFYPSIFLGAVYDDNLYQASTNRVSSGGLNLRPSLLANRDAGIHRTSVYANGNFNFYPGSSDANTIHAEAGFTHTWEATRDLVLKAGAEYGRYTDVFNNGVVVGSSGVIAVPQTYNTVSGYVSGVQSFDKFFVGLSASSIATSYDPLDTTSGQTSETYRDNVVTTVTGRLGYAISPAIYGFAQAAGNFNDFSGDIAYGLLAPNLPSPGTIYNSRGYSVVGGLGSDRIGLFRGEIYAGYQQQQYASALFGTQGSPKYGGKIIWDPTRGWSIIVALDETYQNSGLALSSNTTGSPAYVTTATTTIQYAMAREWTASVGGGYSDVLYLNGGRHDQRWTTGATVNYDIARNLAATFNYSLVLVESNATGGSFTRNQFSLGGTYKY